jgi:hypothetical protein
MGLTIRSYANMNLLCTLALCDGSVTIQSLRITHFAGVFAVCLVLGCVFVSILRRSLMWAPLYVPLFFLHPTWTMDATLGCGVFVRFVSIATSFVLAAILLCQIFWPQLSRRRFLISLCIVSWVAYFSSIYLSQYWNGFLEHGFVRQAIASLMLAETHLLEIAFALSLICSIQWLWYRLQSNRVTHLDLEKRQHSSRIRARLVWAGLGCFFLSYMAVYILRAIKAGRLVPWLPEPVIGFGIGVFLIVAAVRGRLPGWDLPESRHSKAQ